jgi:hypothetical protein
MRYEIEVYCIEIQITLSCIGLVEASNRKCHFTQNAKCCCFQFLLKKMVQYVKPAQLSFSPKF